MPSNGKRYVSHFGQNKVFLVFNARGILAREEAGGRLCVYFDLGSANAAKARRLHDRGLRGDVVVSYDRHAYKPHAVHAAPAPKQTEAAPKTKRPKPPAISPTVTEVAS